MGFSLTIGKAIMADKSEDYMRPCLLPDVLPCEFDGTPASVLTDDKGGYAATRSPSYVGWKTTLAELPKFKAVWDGMQELVKEHRDLYAHCIPCAVYADTLDDLEKEAKAAKDQDATKREMWFVAWSREAIKRYGALAVFKTPGEWS